MCNAGEISSILTPELCILKCMLRFLGDSSVWNNHGIRQPALHQLSIKFIDEILDAAKQSEIEDKVSDVKMDDELMVNGKQEKEDDDDSKDIEVQSTPKSLIIDGNIKQKTFDFGRIQKLKLNNLMLSFLQQTKCDIIQAQKMFYDCYVDIFLVRAIGIHYASHMRRKKVGPYRVKLILGQLDHVLEMEIKQCPMVAASRSELENQAEDYISNEFVVVGSGRRQRNNGGDGSDMSSTSEWLKYVNDSINMRRNDKIYYLNKWNEQLKSYKMQLLALYAQSKMRIESIHVCIHLLDQLMRG